jgi:hypothetical protein
MSENQATPTANNLQEQALVNYLAPFIGSGAITVDQAKFLYMGNIEQAAAAVDNPQERGRFLHLRTAADNARALTIPKPQATNLLDIYRARPSAPPPLETPPRSAPSPSSRTSTSRTSASMLSAAASATQRCSRPATPSASRRSTTATASTSAATTRSSAASTASATWTQR